MVPLKRVSIVAISFVLGFVMSQYGHAHGNEEHKPADSDRELMQQMREMHKGHHHTHDFGAVEALTPEEMHRVVDMMKDIGLVVPKLDSHRGRELFVEKGCIVCHQVNGIGGDVGPSLNASDMDEHMNVFEFAARMWRGAGAMIQMQQELFGEQISLSGQDLADLIAFAHDRDEQLELKKQDVPAKFRTLMEH